MIGQILRQRYQIIKQLGVGGFGETYLAEDLDIPVTPKPVCVVKRLQPTVIDPEIIRLFEQEAQILYQLGQNHDQIPKLSAYFQEGQNFYLIQEFVEGNDLSNEIYPGKKFSEGEVIQLLRDVLEILVYVHENKVIHRDIKPANIMRRKDGKLVLIDFGVVKQINTTIAMKSGFTSKTVGVGTPGYMPSEQWYGKPKLSSDIYALGMMAIEELTGISANRLSEDNDGEIIWSNLVSVSNKLENFITKMVRYDWRQRYKDAKEALAELNQVFGVSKQQNKQPVITSQLSENLYQQGNQLFDLQKYEEAIALYNQAIAIKPDYHESWNSRGNALIELQIYTEALSSFEKAIAIKSDLHEYWINRGRSLLFLHRYEEALSSCEKAISMKYDDYRAWCYSGFSLLSLNKAEDAISYCEKAIAIKPDDYKSWYCRGLALLLLKRYKEALASCEKAVFINSDEYKCWYSLGFVLLSLEKYEEAVTSFDKANEIKSDVYESWYYRGHGLFYSQNYADAIKSYDKAIAINPKDHKVWYNRGLAYLYWGSYHYQDAIPSFQKAIAIQPDCYEAWNNLGWILKNLERYEEALKCYEKAINIKPDFEVAINNRNDLLKQLGRLN